MPKKLLFIPVDINPPPPKAIVVLFGILKELYKSVELLSCPANKIGVGFDICTTLTLSTIPVNVEVVKRKPPVALVGDKTTGKLNTV